MNFAGLKKQDVLTGGVCIKLHSSNIDLDNTLENPTAIMPKESAIAIEGNILNTELEPYTFAIYKFKKK